MKLFAEITKVDAVKRMVFGYASTEALDSQGEIVKIDAIEAALPDYMKFANIREMHQPSAVGIAKEASVDGKGLYLAVKVVDDAAWEKVTEGVYKGFSIGGRATKRDTIDKSIITGLKLTEISLVDRPANPEATFDVFKADGDDTSDDIADEETNTEEPAELEFAAKADDDVEVAKTDEENTEQLTAVDALADMLTKGEISPERIVELANADMNIAKGMNGVSWLASLLKNIKYLVLDQQDETDREGDGSLMPDRLRGWLLSGAEILALMTAEELSELVGAGDATGMGEGVIELAEGASDIEKAGARNSRADQTKIQTVHDHSVSLGATCDSGKHDHSGDMTKLADLESELTKVSTERDALAKRVTELEAQPTVGKALLRAVEKSKDSIIVDELVKTEEEPTFASGEEKAKYLITKMYQQGRAV